MAGGERGENNSGFVKTAGEQRGRWSVRGDEPGMRLGGPGT